MNVFYVPVAALLAQATGGIATSIWAPPYSCRHIAGWQIVEYGIFLSDEFVPYFFRMNSAKNDVQNYKILFLFIGVILL